MKLEKGNLERLVESMPHRVKASIKACGGATRYCQCFISVSRVPNTCFVIKKSTLIISGLWLTG